MSGLFQETSFQPRSSARINIMFGFSLAVNTVLTEVNKSKPLILYGCRQGDTKKLNCHQSIMSSDHFLCMYCVKRNLCGSLVATDTGGSGLALLSQVRSHHTQHNAAWSLMISGHIPGKSYIYTVISLYACCTLYYKQEEVVLCLLVS